MNHRRVTTLFAVLFIASTVCLSAQPFSGYYEIVNADSGMVLEDEAWATTNGAVVDQWIGNGGANQEWTISVAEDGTYEIANVNSGLALEVVGQSTNNGAVVDQWAWWGGANQRWNISSNANGFYQIVNANSGLDLEVRAQSVSDGATIDQAPWSGGTNQQWLILPVGASGTVSPPSGGSGAAASTFHGFNWADPDDNFIDGPLPLSGLSLTDDYSTVQSVAGVVLSGFSAVGANCVRIPINPQTAIGSWWGSYRGVIDEATAMGMKVIIGTWTGSSDESGMVNDSTTFWKMWDIVVTAYNGNGNVYFEILNEPHGYSTADWLTVVSNWLARYPTVAHGRIFVGGTGYDEDIPAVALSAMTSNCLFSVHDYGFWDSSDTTNADWSASLASEVGSYAASTVLTEFGGSMSSGWNYAGGDQGNNEIASVIGFTDFCCANRMGSIYWPGLRDGDSYSLFVRNTNTTGLTLNSPSGMGLLKHGWSYFNGAGTYQIVNGNSGLSLEVSTAAQTNDATISQWTWNGGASQQWTVSGLGNGYSKFINQNSGLALEVVASSLNEGEAIDQRTWTGNYNQQWAITNLANGFYGIINRNSGLALEVAAFATNNGGYVDQWPWNGGANQEWTFGPAASPPVTFAIKALTNGQIQLQWPQGLLLQSGNLSGPWTTNPATSPYIVKPTKAQMFYREIVQ